MQLNFTKMHGLGNDFVVIDAISQTVILTTEQVRFIADRRFGVGCDQLLLVESPDPAHAETVDFKYRIFNADGSEVEQCGNGARCFARFVREKKLTTKEAIVVETFSGLITLLITQSDEVTVNMGIPIFAPEKLPFVTSVGDSQEDNRYTLAIENALTSEIKHIEFSAASMGNPHITIRVDDLDNYPVQEIGKILESHPSFPNRVNVGFMQIIDKHQITLRVYERGSGETLACGTGACAAVANGISHNWLAEQVKVKLPAGNLHIQWQQGEHSLMMTGPASFVYEGQITL
ncbi:MAG: diaminopimelate epimerase [gamma proteobacterium symbiont of Bathyaustriella thionipta]|nr:diaminopimelate epimerase [gamma proteobacterium symbiont of Bathyaustriella thionipta]MCU7950121.1 diaminopimelate epimerase [gamma proteobacterium symbiont of Bathyaustriella thionipta]MCU7954559.1 diaminopimelate epimerase [gamma proteobacterium symbiont of Bathyaustriella thionipta]MCU7957191.1 diaminopimelate epimerase [gamma proteobacterium symbiont of Bathyaustriella thionipta]MCU7968451.1 diaminopimelate epimerase [gamma proteobacterium symbiont of Bathyaustriella thionipta]